MQVYGNSFCGKKVFITGSTGAIGSAVATRLASLGAFVSICGRDEKRIEETVNKIKKMDGKCVGINLDVCKEESIKQAIQQFLAHSDNRIDILINAAGGGARENAKNLDQQSIEVIRRVINTNLMGTIICTRESLPYFSEGGSIISLSSVIGHRGKASCSEYAAAKAGLIGFTKSMAKELGQRKIRVNTVSYGCVARQEEIGVRRVSHIVGNYLNDFVMPEDVIGAIVFLASEEARYITGTDLVVDGGRILALKGSE